MKRRISLTPGTIEALKEGKLLDPLTPGLCTEINAKGRAVWHYRRRIVGTDATFKRTLGLFPAYSIADARTWAARFNELLDAGLDPRIVEQELSRPCPSDGPVSGHQIWRASALSTPSNA